MVGRGTRLHPQKDDLLVIDVVDNSRNHQLAGMHDMFKLPKALGLQGEDVLELSDRIEQTSARYPWLDLTRMDSAEDLQLAAQRIDLMELSPPAEVRAKSHYAWCSMPDGGYRLPLPGHEELWVERNLLDEWEVLHRQPGRPLKLVGKRKSLGAAIRDGDRITREYRPEAVRFIDMREPWREQRPTSKQEAMLRSMDVPIPEGLTRGGASWIIALGQRR